MDTKDAEALKTVNVNDQNAVGGIEATQRVTREMYHWHPAIVSPNNKIAAEKELDDSRSIDMVQNDGMVRGALTTHRDSIVGAKYILNAKPNAKILGAPEGWSEEFQEVVETRFNLLADSPENWFDASRMNTLTGLVRLGVGTFCMTGEVLGTAEWIRQQGRPFNTAVQMINPRRLSNPNNQGDTDRLKSGVKRDFFGAPQSYHIQTAFPNDFTELNNYKWKEVSATTPWGRRQVIHIIEQLFPSEARGVSEMVSALKNMKMTKNFQEVALQNAVIQASYAAAIESELPSELVFGQLGMGGGKQFGDALNQYMAGMAAYMAGAKNISVDGSKIPHLYPGTKLTMQPLGTPGGIGSNFEMSLLRHTAAALGLSYEEFAKDYTQTNYSSARAANANTEKFMRSRKKLVADRLAWNIYALWIEEEVSRGSIPLPPGMTKADFYKPMVKEALCNSDWIGASKGQIDEKKETEAALMRIKGGLSTYEAEMARMGEDWRQVFAQRAREEKLIKSLGLSFSQEAEQDSREPAAEGTTNE